MWERICVIEFYGHTCSYWATNWTQIDEKIGTQSTIIAEELFILYADEREVSHSIRFMPSPRLNSTLKLSYTVYPIPTNIQYPYKWSKIVLFHALANLTILFLPCPKSYIFIIRIAHFRVIRVMVSEKNRALFEFFAVFEIVNIGESVSIPEDIRWSSIDTSSFEFFLQSHRSSPTSSWSI